MFIATISVAIDDFALSHALREVPDMVVKADRAAAHSRHWVMPCLWTAGGDFESFDAALAADPTVEKIVTKAQFENETFYQIEWAEEIQQHIDAALDERASILQAEACNDDWRLTIRFATRNQFDRFRGYLISEEIKFTLEDLTQTSAPQQFMGGLTAAQRDALVTAVGEGYFTIPRAATMDDVADALGISTQSASERLRRGIEGFVNTMLVADGAAREE